MIQYLALLKEYFGPFRLFESNSFLTMLGFYLAFGFSFFLIPKLAKFLPTDRGRAYSVESGAAKGKPTGSGVIFISIFALVSFLIVPFNLELYLIIILVVLTMLTGYLDDKSIKPWGNIQKHCMILFFR